MIAAFPCRRFRSAAAPPANPPPRGAVHRSRLRLTLRAIQDLPLPPAARILELGSGAGVIGVMLAERGYSVESYSVELRGARRPSACLPFCEGAFDLVLAIGIPLEFTVPYPSLPEPVREWARVLKSGGFMIANVAPDTASAGEPHRGRGRMRAAWNTIAAWLRCGARGPKLSRETSAFDRGVAAAGMENVARSGAESRDGSLRFVIARKAQPCPSILMSA